MVVVKRGARAHMVAPLFLGANGPLAKQAASVNGEPVHVNAAVLDGLVRIEREGLDTGRDHSGSTWKVDELVASGAERCAIPKNVVAIEVAKRF